MAFWHRIGKPKLLIQFRRCYIHLPHASSFSSATKPSPLGIPHPYSLFLERPTSVFNSVRFFAAPVQFQVKNKGEDEDTGGRRLNEQIKASYVRLVIGDDHSIVPLFEALERAKKLKLDLVEVQGNAKPPVCKIMDFHKETYKKQERVKERAKSKADMTLRKDCKEVRFSEKTEAKDLKTKADMVKKLMEKGYRVKCKISGKEDQDATELLSPLLALIEDVCVVESGPHMSKKEAFMIVKHVKYGLAKKGGKKSQNASHAKTEEGNEEATDSSEMEEVLSDGAWSNQFGNNDNQTNAAFEASFPSIQNDSVSSAASEENRYRRTDHRANTRIQNDSVSSAASEENRYRRTDHRADTRIQNNSVSSVPSEENRYRRTDDRADTRVQPSAQVPENRYRRVEPRNRFEQPTLNNTGLNNRGPGMRDVDRSTPSNWNQPRHEQVNGNVNQQNKGAFGPGSRHSMGSHENIPQHHYPNNDPRPGHGNFRSPNEDSSKHPSSAPIPNAPRLNSYGIFSTPKGP